MLRDDGLGRPTSEGRLAAEHLVQHAAERIQIASAVDLTAHRLFRAHIGWSAEGEPHPGQPLGSGSGDGVGDSEIGEYGLATFQQNVLGLDVAMNDAVLVGIGQGSEHVDRNTKSVLKRKPLLPRQSLS